MIVQPLQDNTTYNLRLLLLTAQDFLRFPETQWPMLLFYNIGDDLSDIFCIIEEKDLPRFEAMGEASGELSTIKPLSSTRHFFIGHFR